MTTLSIPKNRDRMIAEQIIAKILHERETLSDHTYVRPDIGMFFLSMYEEPVMTGNVDAHFKQFVKATGANISIAHKGACCYNLSHDRIELFPASLFRSSDFMKYAFFHELTHWTGASKRLDRLNFLEERSPDIFGKKYAREEAVAELGAAMLCDAQDVNLPATQFASYIVGYKERFKLTEEDLRQAAFDACVAVNYIRHITTTRN